MTGVVAVRRFWWLVVVFLILGVQGGLGANALTAKVYTSESKLLLTPVSSPSSTDFSATSYVAARGLAYANVAGSDAFLRQVQSNVGAPVGSEYPSITVDLVTGTTLLNITAQDTTAEGAFTAAQVVDKLLVQQSRTLDSSSTGSPQVRINIVANAILPSAPSSTGLRTYLVGGGLIGIVLGVAFAVALGRVRRTASERKVRPDDPDGVEEDPAATTQPSGHHTLDSEDLESGRVIQPHNVDSAAEVDVANIEVNGPSTSGAAEERSPNFDAPPTGNRGVTVGSRPNHGE